MRDDVDASISDLESRFGVELTITRDLLDAVGDESLADLPEDEIRRKQVDALVRAVITLETGLYTLTNNLGPR